MNEQSKTTNPEQGDQTQTSLAGSSPPASPVGSSPPASPVGSSPPASPVGSSPPAPPVGSSPPASPVGSSPPATEQAAGFPECISCIRADIQRRPDEVHKLIRLIACYEALIKLLACLSHAVMVESGAGRGYQLAFKEGFIDKDPTLGDWRDLFVRSRKTMIKTGPRWHAEVVETIFNRPFLQKAAITRLSRSIDRARQSHDTTNPVKRTTINELLERFIKFRNLCFHGAITVGFARKHTRLLEEALAEMETELNLGSRLRFLQPIAFAPRDSQFATVLDPEEPRKAPSECPIGNRSKLNWDRLYVGPAESDSLEDYVCLSPLIVFDETFDDFRFLNRFVDGEFEYLSYKTGAFSFEPSDSTRWEEAFELTVYDRDPDDDGGDGAESGAQVNGSGDAQTTEPGVAVEEQTSGAIAIRPVPQFDAEEIIGRLRAVPEDHRNSERIVLDHLERLLSEFDSGNLNDLSDELIEKLAGSKEGPLRGVGKLLYRLGLYQESAHVFRTALNAAPDQVNPVVSHLLGRSLLKAGTAMKSQYKAERDSDAYLKARSLLQESRKHLESSLSDSAPDSVALRRDVQSLSMLVDVSCRLGEFSAALGYCKRGLTLAERNERLNDQLAYLEQRIGTRA